MIAKHLSLNPLIAACQYKQLEQAIQSKASMVLLLNGGLNDLIKPQFQTYTQTKPILIHTDLLKGLSSDRESIRFLKDFIKPAGIVSTKSSTLRAAKKEGFLTIQRTFLIDTHSLNMAIDSIKETKPDGVEIMPGIAGSIVEELKSRIDCPIILAGLLRDRRDIDSAFQAGADAVSLSNPQLWNYPT
ncbi:glycerol-3-phosphate responsive antiterminator [Spirochaeta cellobiosiphila]|uniref:glycerol-3-phosphate responsive antiterminator n=1 Tax=Spirochaeta cellobiosiphila TaxID=504483 RepID=UPI0003FC814F|nr:glycerol-3-phosphate responsive antiterminator [Spirochaeta cellobiosiphila]